MHVVSFFERKGKVISCEYAAPWILEIHARGLFLKRKRKTNLLRVRCLLNPSHPHARCFFLEKGGEKRKHTHTHTHTGTPTHIRAQREREREERREKREEREKREKRERREREEREERENHPVHTHTHTQTHTQTHTHPAPCTHTNTLTHIPAPWLATTKRAKPNNRPAHRLLRRWIGNNYLHRKCLFTYPPRD